MALIRTKGFHVYVFAVLRLVKIIADFIFFLIWIIVFPVLLAYGYMFGHI